MKTVLSIAGTDPSGGAGIQADLKTIEAHGLYGMAAVTAVIAQNTTGVYAMQAVSPELVARQIDCVFEDIRPDAVKLGMLYSAEIIYAVAERLCAHHAKNIVLDPVLISSSGHTLSCANALPAMIERILPLCTLITPNLHEVSAMIDRSIGTRAEMEQAAQQLALCTRGGILIKGGHLSDCADDLLFNGSELHWLHAPRIENPNTHGTGCTLSSSIACNLALGVSLSGSVKRAKRYLTACIQFGLDLGHGSGPLQHRVEWDE